MGVKFAAITSTDVEQRCDCDKTKDRHNMAISK